MFSTGSYTFGANYSLPSGFINNLISTTYRNKLKLYMTNKSSQYVCDTPDIRAGIFPILNYLKPNELIRFQHISVQYTGAAIERVKTEQRLPSDLDNFISTPTPTEPCIKIVHINRGVTMFKELDALPNLKEHKALSLTLQENPNHKIRCYTELQQNGVMIVTSEYTWELLRKLIACIPILFPQFDIPEEVLDLMALFGGNDFDKWNTAFQNWISQQNFEDTKLQQDLRYLSTYHQTSQLNTKHQHKVDLEHDIQNYLMTLGNLYKNLETVTFEINNLEQIDIKENNELYNYIKKHPYLKQVSLYNNNILRFIIQAPFKYYDTDALKAYYKKTDSIITSNNNIARLFNDVFLEREYTLITECPIKFKLDNCTVSVDRDISDTGLYIPQPHLIGHSCFGSNGPAITKALGQHDYIFAIEQVVASVQNINFTDTTVLRTLIDYIKAYQTRPTLVEQKTGKILSIQDLYNKYKKEDSNETNKNITGSETIPA